MERNGHHYFAGLSMFPEELQALVCERHGDLYAETPEGFASLRIGRRGARHRVAGSGTVRARPGSCSGDPRPAGRGGIAYFNLMASGGTGPR